MGLSFFGAAHERFIRSRRAAVLSDRIASILPGNISVLDVGCGDGLIDSLVKNATPSIHIEGIDVLCRPTIVASRDMRGSPPSGLLEGIKVARYEGREIPFEDKSFDYVMFIDVLHHMDDPMFALQEARRVSKRKILIKDHLCDSQFDFKTLCFMDWVGNARHGVRLPYNYLSSKRWKESFHTLGLNLQVWFTDICLYPKPLSWFFDRNLHFIAELGV